VSQNPHIFDFEMPCSLATSGKYVAEKRLDRWTFNDFMGIYMGFSTAISWGFTWDFQQQFHVIYMGFSTAISWKIHGINADNC